MFQTIRRRMDDMRTIKTLCEAAERHALAEGQREPGAEHFILAALDLPDGTARQAFLRAGADPAGFRDAIARQYADALASTGIDPQAWSALDAPLSAQTGVYHAAPSGAHLMQQLADYKQASGAAALLGAHVLAVGAAAEHGVAARALRRMGLERESVIAAARAACL